MPRLSQAWQWRCAVLAVIGLGMTPTTRHAMPTGAGRLDTCDRTPLLIRGALVQTADGLKPGYQVSIVNGRIASVGPDTFADARGFRVVNGGGHTLLPGLIDAHAHFFELGGPVPEAVDARPRERVFPISGRQALRSGVTSARVHLFDLSEGPAFKRAADDDCFPAPRLQIGGPGFFGGEPGLNGRQVWGVRDTSDAREKVARIAAAGAQWIALHDLDRFPARQLEVLVGTARDAGLRIMAQGNTAAEVELALNLGVQSIEYLDRSAAGAYPDRLVARLAASRTHTAMVPPIGFYQRYALYRRDPSMLTPTHLTSFMPADLGAYVLKALRDLRDEPLPDWAGHLETLPGKFRQLRRAKVNLVVGTDAGSTGNFQIDAIWWELETWRRLGVPPVEAFAAATHRAALLLDDRSIGGLIPGAKGDVLLYKGDIREGELTLSRVRLVAKGGVVHVRDGKWISSDLP